MLKVLSKPVGFLIELEYVAGSIINQTVATINFRTCRIIWEHIRLLQAFPIKIISRVAEKVSSFRNCTTLKKSQRNVIFY
jgi:hypothetical protein